MLKMDEDSKAGCRKKTTFFSLPVFFKSLSGRKRKKHHVNVISYNKEKNIENNQGRLPINRSMATCTEERRNQDLRNGHAIVTKVTTKHIATELRTDSRLACQDCSDGSSFWISEVICSPNSKTRHVDHIQPDRQSYMASHFTSEDFKTGTDGMRREGSPRQCGMQESTRSPIVNSAGASFVMPHQHPRSQQVLPCGPIGDWQCNPTEMFQMLQAKHNYSDGHRGIQLMTPENFKLSGKHWIEADENCNEASRAFFDNNGHLTSFTKPLSVAQSPTHSVTLEQAPSIPPQISPTKPPTVFMTYAEEPAKDEHRRLILSVANFFIRSGINVRLDMHETIQMSSSICGWLQESIDTCDFVIACVSPSYKSQVEQDFPSQLSDHSLLSCYVRNHLLTDYIDNCSRNRKCIPVLVGGATREDLPSFYKNTLCYTWPHDIKNILFRLYRKEMYNAPKLGTVPTCVFESFFT